jgi:tetratricopeptide (TPR) repeat protein
MRTALVWRVALGATILLCARAPLAGADDAGAEEAGLGKEGRTLHDVSESQRALDEAKAILASEPPRRDAAREALERATRADDDRIAVAEAYFRLGVLEEQDRAFERALAAQRACLAEAPTSGWARSARNRIGWISARSEGAFVPLAGLERVRHDPALAGDPASIDALAREAETFPPGRVRAEARMFVVEAWQTRPGKQEDTIAELRKVIVDPSSDSMDASFARRHLVEALVATGRLDEAASEVRTHQFEPKIKVEVERLVRRRTLRWSAIAELIGAVGVAVVVVMRALAVRRRSNREGTLGVPLWGLPRAALAAVATLAAVSVIAAAFLLLDTLGLKFLVDFGL